MNENQSNSGVSVKRYFEYKDDSLYMYSRLPLVFGSVDLLSYVRFYPDSENNLNIVQSVPSSSLSVVSDIPLELRVGEMNYLLSISLLFNPKNKTDYGLPSSQESEDLP